MASKTKCHPILSVEFKAYYYLGTDFPLDRNQVREVLPENNYCIFSNRAVILGLPNYSGVSRHV